MFDFSITCTEFREGQLHFIFYLKKQPEIKTACPTPSQSNILIIFLHIHEAMLWVTFWGTVTIAPPNFSGVLGQQVVWARSCVPPPQTPATGAQRPNKTSRVMLSASTLTSNRLIISSSYWSWLPLLQLGTRWSKEDQNLSSVWMTWLKIKDYMN